MRLCGYGGIGSFELDCVLWTIKGKRKGAAVKISVSLQDTKKFWAPQESHGNLFFIKYADMVELADTQDLGSCIARCAGSSPVIRTKPEKSEPNFPNRKWVRIFCLYLIYIYNT